MRNRPTTPPSPIRYPRKVIRGLWAALAIGTSGSAWADHQVDPALEPLIRHAIAEGECFEDRFDREVWFTAMEPKLKRTVKDANERKEILEQVQCEAKRQRIPAPLVMAVIDVE